MRLACGLAVCAASAGRGATASVQSAPQTRAAAAPLGLVRRIDGSGTVLTRVDPVTLRPRGVGADLPEIQDAWSFSPDGAQVALGTVGQGLGVDVVDLTRRSRGPSIRPIAAEAVVWLEPRRLGATLQFGRLVVLDPGDGRVLRSRSLRARKACARRRGRRSPAQG
jgi:hypothetical protein